jgi:hypothetical protein
MSEDTWTLGVITAPASDQTNTGNQGVLLQSMAVGELPAQEVTLQAILAASGGGGSSGIDVTTYFATAAGTGINVGDILTHNVTVNPTTGVIADYFWINVTQNTKLSTNPIATAISPIEGATNIAQLLGSPIGPSNPIPVYDAFQAPATVTWNSSTALNTAVVVTTAGYDTVIFTFVPAGTITAGQIVFEVYDGYNWVSVKAPRTDSYLTDVAFTLSGSPGTHSWQIPVAGYPQTRARLAVAIVGAGTCQVVNIASSAPDTSLVTVGLDPTSTLPAGTNALGSVNSNGANVSVTPAVTAGAYTAGFVVGGIMTFANALPASFNGLLESITLKFKGTLQTGSWALALFSASPTGTFGDHAAPAIASTDSALLLGIYTMNTPSSILGTHTIYNADGLAKALVGASTALYGVLICTSAPTSPASTSELTVTVGVAW